MEVQSPSTALYDRNTKKAAYVEFGVRSYWIVVPDPDRPSLTALELRDRGYVKIAHGVGETPFRATTPFPVTVLPAGLVAGLRPDDDSGGD